MRSTILTATGLALALALPAAAQSTQSQSNNSSSSGQQSGMGQGNMNIRQHVTQGLEQAGFTDVHVMPESFLVRAKDKQGQPVMMLINLDSLTTVTALTEVSSNGQSGSGNNGSGNTKSVTKY